MKLALVCVAIVAILVWYALAGRCWLKTQPWAQSFFAFVEPIEAMLYRKSETILVGRMLWVGGAIVTAYDSLAVFASSLDLTPVTARLLYFVPEDMRGIVVSAAIGLLGLIINWMRKRTSKPLELVAAPTTPETIAVEQKVEAANAEAVATVVAVEKAA